ncbi:MULTISPECIES: hypothetical protein [Acetobacter]|uniref:hypothetical protein n=1 Tax=Acetobacter TaxID=434 RepID=UPI0002E60CB5|nr:MULTISPECIES: hypothetical protein [Acetobacter]ATI11081.1 hypothetical protein CPF11_00570 [Acetobacter pomorum]AXC26578.1 hypothetical protein DS739_07095 [Acetobacter sp. JWB]KAA8386063.1 hypothetical protein FKW31_07805 [Acetobacter sp. DmW_136]KAA8420387.1 hypothetical protein FKW54_14215 [Acetobacter pomorum]KAA8431436.1 hypothetical protein FKW50_13425 [Acetobacter pomorum]
MSDFVFKRGTTFLVTCINQDAQGAPIDLGGAVIAAELRDSQNALIAPLVPAAVPDQPGTYTLSYPGDTSGWPLGMLRTDVRISKLDGTIVQTGTVTIAIVDRVTQ